MAAKKKFKKTSKKTANTKRPTKRRTAAPKRKSTARAVSAAKVLKSSNRVSPAPVSERSLTYKQKLAIVKKFEKIKIARGKKLSAADKAKITRAYKAITPLATDRMIFMAADAETIKRAKAEGHHVTKKGVFVARPVDARGEPIKGASVEFDGEGVTIIRKGQRVQFELGFTPLEVRHIVADFRHIDDVVNDKLKRNKELQRKFKRSKDKSIKLVFGKYLGGETIQGINQLNNYLSKMNANSREYLTGIRFVFHTEKKKNDRKTASAARKKK